MYVVDLKIKYPYSIQYSLKFNLQYILAVFWQSMKYFFLYYKELTNLVNV